MCSLLHACEFINPKMKRYEIAGWKAASVGDRSGRFTASRRDKRAGVVSPFAQIGLSGLSGIHRLLLTPNRKCASGAPAGADDSFPGCDHSQYGGGERLTVVGRKIDLSSLKNCSKARLERKLTRLDPRGGVRSHI